MSQEYPKRTRGERRASQRYMWEIGAGAVAFLFLFLFLPDLVPAEPGSAASIVVALVPLLPVLGMAVAVMRHVHRVDELQRMLLLRSLAVAFGVAMLIALTIAFLSTAGVRVAFTEWYVFIGGMAAFGVVAGVLSLRANR